MLRNRLVKKLQKVEWLVSQSFFSRNLFQKWYYKRLQSGDAGVSNLEVPFHIDSLTQIAHAAQLVNIPLVCRYVNFKLKKSLYVIVFNMCTVFSYYSYA